jgi:hypothetical protein
MIPAKLMSAEKRMKQKWRDLALAEQQGASPPVLERMYNAYILAVEEYNRCSSELQQQEEASSASSERNNKRRRKAS